MEAMTLVRILGLAAMVCAVCGCESSPVEKIAQDMKAEAQTQDDVTKSAKASVRRFVAQELNMQESEAKALEVYVAGQELEWALLKSERGIQFIARRGPEAWTMVAMGTSLEPPAELPVGLAMRLKSP